MKKIDLINRLESIGIPVKRSSTKTDLETQMREYELTVRMQADSIRPGLCAWLGILTPLMIAILGCGAEASYHSGSWVPGTLLAGAALTILAVSLTHLQEGIAKITGSTAMMSWLAAIAIDIGLVGCELSIALDGALWWNVGYVVVATLTSMALNWWAFANAHKN